MLKKCLFGAFSSDDDVSGLIKINKTLEYQTFVFFKPLIIQSCLLLCLYSLENFSTTSIAASKTLKPYIFNEYILCTQIVELASTPMKVVPTLRDIQTYTAVNDKKKYACF